MASCNASSTMTIAPSDQRGSALLEVAIVIPVLLSIGLGVFEFGNMYYKYHLMENAVRDAARFAASKKGDVCSTQSLKDEVSAIARRTGGDSKVWTTGWTITVSCTSYNNKANGYKFRGGDTVKSVKVTASIPYQQLGFLGFFKLGAPTLTTSHEERVFGVR